MATKSIHIPDNAVNFGDRLASSAAFKTLFQDGMALVEETAAYLDGKGRDDARHLNRSAALTYASESMRLTTRLMQIASWLLLQRAVNEGEMSQAEAASDKRRTQIAWQTVPQPGAAEPQLPVELLELIDASLRLQTKIVRLDAAISEPFSTTAASAQPLDAQMARLRQAFPGAA